MLTGALRGLRPLRGLPRPQGQPELPGPAGGAHRHRGPRRLRAAVLQRQRAEVQHQDPDVPGGALRRTAEVHEAGVLRGRRGRAATCQVSSDARLTPHASSAHAGTPHVRTDPLQQATLRGSSSWASSCSWRSWGAVAGYLAGFGPVGAVIALVVAGGLAFASYWKSDAVALAVSRAQPGRPRRVQAAPQPGRGPLHRRRAAQAPRLRHRRPGAQRLRHRPQPASTPPSRSPPACSRR